MTPTIEAIKEAADLPAIVESLTGHPGSPGGLYHCPVCGSGDGPNHTGALSIDPAKGNTQWHCFSCGNGGDVLDLAGFIGHTDDLLEKRRIAAGWAGMPTDSPYTRPTPRGSAMAWDSPAVVTTGPGDADGRLEAERSAIEAARAAIGDPEAVAYLEGRGIGQGDAVRLGLGYDRSARRVVIPVPGAEGYHLDRAIDHDGDHKYHKPRGLRQPIWNPAAMDGECIVVVEGPMDALALDLAGYGGQAVALCGTAWRDLVEALRARQWRGTVIAALDADEAGRRAQGDLVAALTESGIAATGADPWAELGAKDAAEAWAKDPAALTDTVARAVADGTERARREAAEARAREYEATLERLHVVSTTAALMNVYELRGMAEPIPTGIGSLDAALGGGLAAGLYALGATSSLGKTTLMGQIADAVAAQGRPVLFVTLEQSAEEMAAKALSRYMDSHPGPDGKTHLVTARDLMRPSWRDGMGGNPAARDALLPACDGYSREVGDRLRYLVADDEPTVEDVAAIARSVAEGEGLAPLVIVDYLQILKVPDGSLSDKQATDRNVTALRRLARDLVTPVLTISSLNRASYSGTVTMEAFKESGSIEYGSDVLMGLQPWGMGEEMEGETNADRAKRKGRKIVNDSKLEPVRDVAVTVLKNRWGPITGEYDGVRLEYRALANRFVEPGR